MSTKDYKDLVGGAAFAAFGLGVFAYSLTSYQIGTLRAMGPGLFPAALGAITCGFGIIIAVGALFKEGSLPRIDLRPLVAILASIGVFGLLVQSLGMVPAIIATTIVASLADRNVRFGSVAVVAVALSGLCYLVFRLGLNLPYPMFAWY